jgi:hypothetical protein
METVQNGALRIATGCHMMSKIAHLHTETKVLPLRVHAEMISKQYLAACHQQNHPSRDITDERPPPRKMKKTLTSQFGDEVRALLPMRPTNKQQNKDVVAELHKRTVQSAIAQHANNEVLGRKPPKVHRSEETLPRKARASLAQLRSGYCKLLGDYQQRVFNGPNVCLDCYGSPHDVSHLFECPRNPTDLTKDDLWLQPVAAAAFLKF